MTHTPTTARRTSTGVAVLLAAACAAALAFLIVGLAGVGKIPAADVPAAVAPAPVSVPVPAGPTNAEYRFLQIVNNGAPHAQSVMTQVELLRIGHTVCSLETDPGNPLTRPQMANAIAENGVSLDDASLLVVAAEDELC